jgi:hypothetical protein
LEERWHDAGFIRIHRSFLVALSEVTELRMEGGRTCVRLGDQLLPVSRRHIRQVREALVRQARTRPPEGRPAGPPSPGGEPSATVVPPVQRRTFPNRGGAG